MVENRISRKERGEEMAKKTSVDKIIRNLRKVEVLQSQGRTVAQACKEISVSEQTYYRWRKEYGRLSLDQARRLNELEDENARLKKLVADLALDKAILKEALSGK